MSSVQVTRHRFDQRPLREALTQIEGFCTDRVDLDTVAVVTSLTTETNQVRSHWNRRLVTDIEEWNPEVAVAVKRRSSQPLQPEIN